MDERTPACEVLVRARCVRVRARVCCACVCVCVCVVCVRMLRLRFRVCWVTFLVYALGASDCMTDSDGRSPHGMHALNICKGRLW